MLELGRRARVGGEKGCELILWPDVFVVLRQFSTLAFDADNFDALRVLCQVGARLEGSVRVEKARSKIEEMRR